MNKKRYIMINREGGSKITIDLDKLLEDYEYETEDGLGWKVYAEIIYK